MWTTPLFWAFALLVERLPGGVFVGEGAEAVGVLGPVGRRQTQRVHPHLGAVEQLVEAADDVPVAVSALVGVVVADGLVDPPVAFRDLALAIDVASGVVVVDQVDLVGADVQDRRPDGRQLLLEVGPQGIAAVGVPAHPHVVGEQPDQGVQVSPVHGHRVSGRQLPDLLTGQQAGDVVHLLILARRRCLSRGEPISGKCQ